MCVCVCMLWMMWIERDRSCYEVGKRRVEDRVWIVVVVVNVELEVKWRRFEANYWLVHHLVLGLSS